MKIITLEEHFADAGVAAASRHRQQELAPDFAASGDPSLGISYSPSFEVLNDLGEARIADMDANGISMQVLSCLNTQLADPSEATGVVRAANDRAAAAVGDHPDRFAAFAALPTTVPGAAVDELTRCVEELGFVGTMIFGRTDDEFLDADRFRPILYQIQRLGVPLYLHPGFPTRATTDQNYAALDPIVTARLQTSAWGWHQETAVHFLHLVLSGVFDRLPELQLILGHWGEMIPFYLDRLDEALPQKITGLDRTIGQYVRQNTYLTPSGMWSQAQLQFCVETVGVDRIMYSVDYPFIGNDSAASFLTEARLSDAERHAIAHGTAERVFGIRPA